MCDGKLLPEAPARTAWRAAVVEVAAKANPEEYERPQS
jgi:hypothetical protein